MGDQFKINPLVIVGVPTLNRAPQSWAWADNYYSLSFPLGSTMSRIRVEGVRVADARNALVQKALDTGADYLMMVGDDVHLPANAFSQMWSHRAPIVTGVYWTKGHPLHPYLWRGLLKGPYLDWTVGECFPVDFAGCDCLLVHTDVFRAIEPPWFSVDWVFEPGAKPSEIATEDFYFFTKARAAGFVCLADTMVQCYHEDRASGGLFGLMPGMRQAATLADPDDMAEGEILVADLGAGLSSPLFGERATVVRFDAREDTRPDVRCDLRSIPHHHHGRYDIAHSRHVLEHFGAAEAPELVRHWAKLVKVGGELLVNVPDIEQACRDIVRGEETGQPSAGYSWQQLYGAQQYSLDFHKNGFTRRALANLLGQIPNFGEVAVGVDGPNLVGRATRLRDDTPLALGPVWREIEAREAADRLAGTAEDARRHVAFMTGADPGDEDRPLDDIAHPIGIGVNGHAPGRPVPAGVGED